MCEATAAVDRRPPNRPSRRSLPTPAAGSFNPPPPPAVVLDVQFNPLLTFNARLPFTASAAYPGGLAAMLADYTAITRKAAQVGRSGAFAGHAACGWEGHGRTFAGQYELL